MKIYVWPSEAFRGYGAGTIYAIGEDVNDARNKIKQFYKDHDRINEILDDIELDNYSIEECGYVWGSA